MSNNKNNSSEMPVRRFEKVCEILEKYSFDHSKLIPILQAIQEEYRYLPEEILTFVASSLDLSPANVYGVATFYAHFTLEPKGKYIIKVCDGTACHVKNSVPIIEEVQSILGLKNGKNTTDDMLFTLETVSCLGACGLAPVVVVNEEVYSQMNPSKVAKVINKILESEKELENA